MIPEKCAYCGDMVDLPFECNCLLYTSDAADE